MHEDFKKGLLMNIPVEFTIGGVYLPPILIASIFGIITTTIVTRLLNRYRLSQYFFYPPIVFVAMSVIFTIFFGTVAIAF